MIFIGSTAPVFNQLPSVVSACAWKKKGGHKMMHFCEGIAVTAPTKYIDG